MKLSKQCVKTCWLRSVFPVHPKVGLEFVGTTDVWYAQGGIDGLAFNQPTNQLFAFWALVIAMLATRVCNSAHQLTKLMRRRSNRCIFGCIHANITIIYTLYTHFCWKQLQSPKTKNTSTKLSHSWSAFSGSPLPPRTFSHWPRKRFSWHPGHIGASTSTISLPARWVAPKPLSETSQQMSFFFKVWRCVKGCVYVWKSMFLLVVSFVECLSIVIVALKVADWTKLTSCLYLRHFSRLHIFCWSLPVLFDTGILSPWLGPRTWARRLACWICQAWLNWVLTFFFRARNWILKKSFAVEPVFFSGSLGLSLLDNSKS